MANVLKGGVVRFKCESLHLNLGGFCEVDVVDFFVSESPSCGVSHPP